MQNILSTIVRNRQKIADGLRLAAYLIEQLQNPSTRTLKNAKVTQVKTLRRKRKGTSSK